MKAILVMIFVITGSLANAAPSYTLSQICDQYGAFGQCASVPFCQASFIQDGCQLADGAQPYMEGLCQLQQGPTAKQGCSILQAQGNCKWVDAHSSCDAKTDHL